MSEGQPPEIASNPPMEAPRSDTPSFQSEQEQSHAQSQLLDEELQRWQQWLQRQLLRQQQQRRLLRQQQQRRLQPPGQQPPGQQPPGQQPPGQRQLRQHQQRYYLYLQALVTAVYIGLHHFDLYCPPYCEALSSFMLFLSETLSMVTAANEITRGFLFLGTNGVVIHQLTSVNSFTFEKRKLLRFGEACSMSLPPMVHVSMILLCLALNFVLLFRVYPGIQCVLLLLCILMPLYYFAELAHKAAGIAVELGSYKMPLVWFSTLGGLAMALICGLMVLLIVFCSWLYARRRGLQFQGIRLNGDAIIGAMNA